jgi:chromosome segregation ATPase
VHVLAEDLSNAREAQRTAQREMAPYLDADRDAKGAYLGAHAKLRALGGDRAVDEPTSELASAARAMADALERWRLAHHAARDAHGWLEGKARDVTDLEFQVDALRAQLERLEASYENERAVSEAVLARDGEEMARLEQRLTQLGSTLAEPLRAHRNLGDLFAQLEQEGTPAVGLSR